MAKQSLKDAKIDFKRMGFSGKKDFFALDNKEKAKLEGLLDITKYTKSKTAPGSKLRAFYEALTR